MANITLKGVGIISSILAFVFLILFATSGHKVKDPSTGKEETKYITGYITAFIVCLLVGGGSLGLSEALNSGQRYR